MLAGGAKSAQALGRAGRASPSKAIFLPPFPQLKGRKNKKLPQLVKIFLDDGLSP